MNVNEALKMYRDHTEMYGYTTVTYYDYSSDTRKFADYLMLKHGAAPNLVDVTGDDVYEYLKYLRYERGLKPSTVNRHRDSLSSVFKCLEFTGVIQKNPVVNIKRIKIDREERFYLEEATALKLFDAMENPVVHLAARTMFYTGIRAAELVHLSLIHIDLNNGIIFVHGKGRNERTIPIHKTKLLPYLRVYHEWFLQGKDPYSRFFQLEKTGRISNSTLNKELAKASCSIGTSEVVTCHTLRHSFATHYLYNGGHLHELQRLMGHKNLTTTGQYLHANLRSIEIGINQM